MNRIIILVIFLSFTTSLQAQSVESDELFSKGVELYNLKRYNEEIMRLRLKTCVISTKATILTKHY